MYKLENRAVFSSAYLPLIDDELTDIYRSKAADVGEEK